MFGKKILCFCLMFALLMFTAAVGSSREAAPEIESMRGLGGIGVEIDEIDPEAVNDGLNGDKLLVTVTQALKGAGIKVVAKNELSAVKGTPSLFVNINTIKHSGGVYSFTVNIGLGQLVTLARDPGIKVIAPTWSVLGTGASLPEDLSTDVEKYVKLLVDRFVEDYKAVNPD